MEVVRRGGRRLSTVKMRIGNAVGVGWSARQVRRIDDLVVEAATETKALQ